MPIKAGDKLPNTTFRVMTAVWGVGYLIEAAVRVVIVEHTSTGTALASSRITPYLFAAILAAWTALYGIRQRRKGEKLAQDGRAAEAATRAESGSGDAAASEAAAATPDP